MPFLNKEILLLDDEDKWILNEFSLWIDRYGYVICDKMRKRKKYRYRIHRLVLNYHELINDIDHINGNKLDNRKENLRICDRAENILNRPKRKDSKQKYKGVQRLPSGNFSAKAEHGKRLGTFQSAEDAYECYQNYIINKIGYYPIRDKGGSYST